MTNSLNSLKLIIAVQLGQYKQQPLLNIGFILSLAIATATLLSILILNYATKQQYQQADTHLESPIAYYIVPKTGNSLTVANFAKLRHLGFSQLQPVLSFRKKLNNGNTISLQAVDLLPLVLSSSNGYATDKVSLSASYANKLGLTAHSHAQLAEEQLSKSSQDKSQGLPLLMIKSASFNEFAMLDMAYAWQRFPEHKNSFSYLIVGKFSPSRLDELSYALPDTLLLQSTPSLADRAELADALHLNLTALALMGFIVSLFIAFQAADQAWHNRSATMMQLRLLGIDLSLIRIALLFEALSLIVIASVIGVLMALTLVSLLLPLLGLTLAQLYQLNATGQLIWQWHYFTWSLLISSCAVVVALIKQFNLINNRKLAQLSRQITVSSTSTSFIIFSLSMAMLLAALAWLWPSLSWTQLMIKHGFILLLSVAFLPCFLMLLLWLLAKLPLPFKFSYTISDSQNQIKTRFLPLAAFFIALTSSSAAALMNNSFERAFVSYLDQHLSEDIYLRFTPSQQQHITQWLASEASVTDYVLYYQGSANFNDDSISVKVISSIKQTKALVFKQKSAQTELHALVNGCYINEQLALKRKLTLGQTISLTQQSKKQLSCHITGIYFNYGNPNFEVTIAADLALAKLNLKQLGFGLYAKQQDDHFIEKFIDKMTNELQLNPSQLYQANKIKTMALTLFKQTFLLTQAIAAVLLAIACFGLFLSANSLELARKNDLIMLISLGYNRRALFTHMLMQWLLLTLGCMALSWPITIVLADALVTKILPASFGWSMPLVIELTPLTSTSFIALGCLLLALYIPLRQLTIRQTV